MISAEDVELLLRAALPQTLTSKDSAHGAKKYNLNRSYAALKALEAYVINDPERKVLGLIQPNANSSSSLFLALH